MSNHKIDQLFKSKMEHHQVQPSAAAWGKLDAELNKKSKKGMIWWISAAASVTLLVVAGWWMTKGETPTEHNTIATQEAPAIDKAQTQDEQPNDVEAIAPLATVEEVTSQPDNTVSTHKKVIIPSQSKTVDNTAEKLVPTEKIEKVEEEIIPALIEDELQEEELLAVNEPENETSIVPQSENKPITLVYTLKPIVKADTTSVEAHNKKSVLGKMLAFAKNVKESDAGLGQLREAKDNLLSFNKK